MDNLNKHQSELTGYSFFWIFMSCLLSIGSFLLCQNVLDMSPNVAAGISVLIGLILAVLAAKLVVLASSDPLKAIWQAVWHISPNGGEVPAPTIDKLTHGRELADSLVRQIYELASNSAKTSPQTAATAVAGQPTAAAALSTTPAAPTATVNTPTTGELFDIVPLPLIALDSSGTIVMCNKLVGGYIGQTSTELVGKSLQNVMQLTFQGNQTLTSWLQTVRGSNLSADSTWERVRLQLPDDKGQKQFDMIAHFGQDSASGYETLLAIFDHTDTYTQDDNSTSYVALAVHELRTPLTVLRGYIEVFEDELDDKLTPELKEFMQKMKASAQTLTAFVSNILNVARVDENQLALSLHEGNWNDLLLSICKDLELRAKVRGKTIEYDIAPNLPTVAIDKVSIYEVISNLIDNAIKYSGESNKIIVHASKGTDGRVQTVVQDFGSGIPEGALKHLFTKFYRSHRSKSRVGGSGLGLYLVKAIVTAHGGDVWVQSKEGEGSSFGFSLLPFSSMGDELKNTTSPIERQAHGWIKNHSMYRKQ